jgi:fused signal recognition particle receptor
LLKNFKDKILKTFISKRIDKKTLDSFEEILIQSDIDIDTAGQIVSSLSKSKFSNNFDIGDVENKIEEIILEILAPAEKPLKIVSNQNLTIILCIGVNGSGKTTTLAKLANKFVEKENQVLLVAADTFRAAATEQLSIWANRLNIDIVKGELNSDPASVAFQSLEKADISKKNIVLIDTAGRLHNKSDLMDQLGKIDRVLKKVNSYYPHETIITIDATTGQNAIKQVEEFNKHSKISGIIMTKYDSSASGGTLISIANKFSIPVYAIGTGETLNDLEFFNARDFASKIIKQ